MGRYSGGITHRTPKYARRFMAYLRENNVKFFYTYDFLVMLGIWEYGGETIASNVTDLVRLQRGRFIEKIVKNPAQEWHEQWAVKENLEFDFYNIVEEDMGIKHNILEFSIRRTFFHKMGKIMPVDFVKAKTIQDKKVNLRQRVGMVDKKPARLKNRRKKPLPKNKGINSFLGRKA